MQSCKLSRSNAPLGNRRPERAKALMGKNASTNIDSKRRASVDDPTD
ncbi:hypothetical protein OAF34_06010 [Pirellulaceae bacterium]|nr:hypothetical protein [Pirellulaceae bacterium]